MALFLAVGDIDAGVDLHVWLLPRMKKVILGLHALGHRCVGIWHLKWRALKIFIGKKGWA